MIANDVIQTLGTFLASNSKKQWWVLWGFAALILAVTLFYGWYINAGDVSYGRLGKIPLPEQLEWWYLLAPVSLLIITRYGIPVSTTFMILSVFSTGQIIEKMILKSLLGYAIAFIAAILLYFAIARKFESKGALKILDKKKHKKYWIIAQWFSTGFLWSQWLNVVVTTSASIPTSTIKIWGFIVIGLVSSIVGGKIIVENASELASMMGVSQKIIGLTIVAAGTSLPELVTSVVAAFKKNSNIAIGNIIGSNIFNMLLVLGTSAIIQPITYNLSFNNTLYFLTGGTALLLLAMFTGKRRKLDRREAFVLLCCFLLYNVFILKAV